MTAVTTQPAAGAPVIPAGAAPAIEMTHRAAAPSLRRNFLLTLSGNVIYAGCQWGILVVLAKLINPEMVGQFVLGLAVTAPLFFLANLQLANLQATDAKRQTSFETYLRLRLLTTAGALVVLVGIVLVCRYPARTAAVILVIGAAKAFDALTDLYHGLYQQNERMHHVSASLIINGVVSLAATALVLWWKRDVVWASAAFAFGSLVALAFYNIPAGAAVWRSGGELSKPSPSLWRALVSGAWDARVLGRLAWLAAPLGIAAALSTLNGNLPRYFIHAEFGDRPLGVFAAMAYVMTAGVTFVGALCYSASPRLARTFAEHDFAAFKRLVVKILAVATAAGIGGLAVALLAGRQLLSVLYRPEYAEHSSVFTWLMVAAAAAYVASALGYAVTATRAFSMLTAPYAIVTVITLAACWLLIPPLGLSGAAWAMGISGLAACVANLAILARVWMKYRESAAAVQ